MCAWSWACPGVEGSAGAPKPSAQLSLDRNVLLEEQGWFVHGFFQCVCAHLMCLCLKESSLHRVALGDCEGRGMWVSCPELCAFAPDFIPG